MKVFHINCNYLTTVLHQTMIEHLDAAGCENVVFAPTYDVKKSVITPRENVCVAECFRKRDRLFFDLKQRKIIRAAGHACDIASVDCIHAYTVFTDGNCAMHLAEKYNKPFVVAVRGTDLFDFFRFMIHLRGRGIKILRKAKAIFFLSEAYQKKLLEKYIPRKYHKELLKKSHIVPNGIDSFWLKNRHTVVPEEMSAQKIWQVVYAGQIIKLKNVPMLQRAMALLREKGYAMKLTVVGKPVDPKEFKRVKQDPYTNCLPAMPKEDLVHIYRKSDMFAMVSHPETFGLVYAEAISQGIPVIYSAGEGFDGQFPEGVVGFHADASSAESVAEAIEKVITDYQAITENLSSRAERFSWSKIAARYIELYKQLTA